MAFDWKTARPAQPVAPTTPRDLISRAREAVTSAPAALADKLRPSRFDPSTARPVARQEPSLMGDIGRELGAGAADLVAAGGRVLEATPLRKAGGLIRQEAERARDAYIQGLSPEQRAAEEKPIFPEEGGVDWSAITPRKIGGAVTRSLPAMVLGGAGGAAL